MDWETLYCPNVKCNRYGIPFGESRLVRNGASHGYAQALCKVCGSSVSLRYGTAYMHLEAEAALFETAVRALAEGNFLRATARSVQIDKDTACTWLARAGQHGRLVQLYLWQQLHVTECQLDELWSFVHTQEQRLPSAKLYDETYGDAWVWIAFVPLWHWMLAFVVGKRVQENAEPVSSNATILLGGRAIGGSRAGPTAFPKTAPGLRNNCGLLQSIIIWGYRIRVSVSHSPSRNQRAVPVRRANGGQ